MVTEKAAIVAELGEEALLLPASIARALRANERAKYFFALLQNARISAEHPEAGLSNLAAEREAAGEADVRLDSVVSETRLVGPGRYTVLEGASILGRSVAAVEEMLRPLAARPGPAVSVFRSRLDALRTALAASEGDVLTGAVVDAVVSGSREGPDSLHLLVLDLHRAILGLQSELSVEEIDGASVYDVQEGDRPLIAAFMRGLHRTAPLKFDHPGLATTATRVGERLVIQNDIGETDAHVIVISVERDEVTVTYSDIHRARLEFFQELLTPSGFVWQKVVGRVASQALAGEEYFLAVGRCHPPGAGDLESALATIGSRVVFLIDWNRARKDLRNFLRNPEATALLRWAAHEEVGHRGYLVLGGGDLIREAIDLAPKGQIQYRQRLSDVLGVSRSRQYFQWVLRAAAKGLLTGQPRALLRDEVKAELLRYFHTLDEDLLGMCVEQASLLVELATSLEDSLGTLKEEPGTDVASRQAVRAKEWEKSADDLVVRVRAIARRSGSSSLFRNLVGTVDDAVDALEDGAFSLRLASDAVRSPRLYAILEGLAQTASRASREFLKTVCSVQLLGPASREEEMQEFLESADRVASLEEEADVGLRNARQEIWSGTGDLKASLLALEVAQYLEQATNHLKRAAYTIKDEIFEQLNRGAFRFDVE